MFEQRRKTEAYIAKFAQCAHLQPVLEVKRYIFWIGYVTGVDFYFGDYRYSLRTANTCMLAVVGFLFAVYTTWELRDSLDFLPSAATLGFSVPGVYQVFYCVSHAAQLGAIIGFGDLIYLYNNTLERNPPLLEVAKRARSTAVLITALTFFGLACYSSDQVYEMLWNRNLKLPLILYMPFVDPTSALGFWVTMAMQILMSIIAVIGHLHWTVMITILALQLRAMGVILEFQMQDFQRMYMRSRNAAPAKREGATMAEEAEAEMRGIRAERKAFLRNMLMQFNDTNRFVNILQGLIGHVITLQIATETIAIVIALFATVASGYRAGYGISIMLIIEILTNCYMGTQLVIEYERLEQVIYSVRWYEFEVSDQRMFLLLLHKCQNMQTIIVGGQWALSMDVGTSILKFIYNSYAMMLNFLE